MNRAQRIYVYVVLAATTLLTAYGLAQLLGALIDQVWPGRIIGGTSATGVALGIAFIVVAGPVWLLHWRFAEGKIRQDPSEAQRGWRQAYLAFVMAFALGFAGHGTASVVSEASGGDLSLSGGTVARLIVWSTLWWLHWALVRRSWVPGHAGRSWHRWYLYLVATAVAVVAVIGLGRLLGSLIAIVLDATQRQEVLQSGSAWSRSQQNAFGMFIVGLGLWVVHWRVGARGDRGSVLRDVHTAVVATAASAMLAVSASMVLISLVRYTIGSTGDTLFLRLQGLSGWLGLALALAPGWYYYSSLLLWPARALEVSYARPVAAWAYRYAAMGIGLGLLATGGTVLIATLGSLVIPENDVLAPGTGALKDGFAVTIVVAALGLAIWIPLLARVRRAEDAGNADRVTAERFYLFAITGASLLAAVGAATTLLFFILNDALQGDLGSGTVDAGRWAAGITVSAGAIALLHGRAIRSSPREALSALTARRKRVVLVAPEGAGALRAALENALGREIEWRIDLAQPALPAGTAIPMDIAEMALRAEGVPGRTALVVWTADGIRLVAYE